MINSTKTNVLVLSPAQMQKLIPEKLTDFQAAQLTHADRTAHATACMTKTFCTLLPKPAGTWWMFCASSGVEIYWTASELSAAADPCEPHVPVLLKPCLELWLPQGGNQHLGDPCGSTCLTHRFHTKFLTKSFLLLISLPAGLTGPLSWRTNPCQPPCSAHVS